VNLNSDITGLTDDCARRKEVVMISRCYEKTLFLTLFLVMFVSQGCGGRTLSAPSITVVAATETMVHAATKTLSPDSIETANFQETASMKDIILTDIPTATATKTSVPLGVFTFFFYSPLIIDYDPSVWELKNTLQAKDLASCYIAEQGPTDFNGPHTIQIMQLGNVKYEVLSFPDSPSPQGVISQVYIAEQALATEWGLPVFWISAKLDEWDKCKPLAEKVLATLHSPVH
jgi:hypothetical protein